MDYQATLSWMFNKLPMYQRIGGAAYKADLNNTLQLAELLNQPQRQFKAVHIAGTNGKGSVAHLLASVLQEAGHKTGLYTSPHLKDFRERIRINGEMIPPEKVTNFIQHYKQDFEKMELSFFEMTVGLAFQFFADEKVDIAIVETGMGGRLDSTNILEPELSLITNIGLDHIRFLGNTMEQIAAEKAGIIKKHTTVIVGETQAEIVHVFKNKASEMEAELIFADQVFETRRMETPEASSQYYDIWKNAAPYLEKLEVGLSGDYQQKNILTAICVLDKLREAYGIDDGHIREGFARVVTLTGLLGRWQILDSNPVVVADAAHNLSGLREVVLQLKQMEFSRLHIVLGMVDDKQVEDILQILPRQAQFYFCKPDIPRGMDAEKLAGKAFEIGLRGEVYNSVRDAYLSADNNAAFNDLIFIGGSTFVVAEVV